MSRYSLLIDNKTIYVDMRNVSSAYAGGMQQMLSRMTLGRS